MMSFIIILQGLSFTKDNIHILYQMVDKDSFVELNTINIITNYCGVEEGYLSEYLLRDS